MITPAYIPRGTFDQINRVGQNRIYAPNMTVYLVISLPKYRIYTVYIGFWPTLQMKSNSWKMLSF